MDKQIIERHIRILNSWWIDSWSTPVYKERTIELEIERYMKSRQIIALTGLRRVGKTVILLKTISSYLQKNFPKKNIFYFSFDEYKDARIQDILDIYELMIGKGITSENYLFVFDEIQKVKNWEEQIKSLYDIYPNIKFMISGSESLFIRRKSRESLAGRIYEFKINPLSFREYLDFKGKEYDGLLLWKDQILKEFRNFLLCNGFPEIINAQPDEAKKYIAEGIIERVIYRDIAEVFEVKDTTLLKSIFDVIYNNPGQIIELAGLSKELGITRQTLSKYLEYLEESYLIKKLYNYSRNARKTQRRLKKYYSTIINPLLINDEFSKVFEQSMVIQTGGDYFWRDSYKNEVDIVMTEPLTAIEIKSGEIKERDLAGLEYFKKKFKPQGAFVISYDTEKHLCGIEVRPFYKHLLAKKIEFRPKAKQP